MSFRPSSSAAYTALTLSLLSLLPGCTDFFTGTKEAPKAPAAPSAPQAPEAPAAPAAPQKDTSEILMTVNGKPTITVAMFEDYFKQYVESQPGMEAMIPLMGQGLKQQLFEQMADDAVLVEWINRSDVKQQAEYQKMEQQMHEMIERLLAHQFFRKEHPVTVTDADIKKYYEEHKGEKPFLISPAGVKVSGVAFDTNKEAAQAFLAKSQADGADIAKLAEADSLRVTPFGIVSEKSGNVSPALRTEIVAVTTVPSVKLMHDGDAAWVVHLEAKEEAKYQPFDYVQDYIKELLTQNKMNEQLSETVNKLKKEYNVTLNEAYFAAREPEAPEQPEQQPIAQ